MSDYSEEDYIEYIDYPYYYRKITIWKKQRIKRTLIKKYVKDNKFIKELNRKNYSF